MGKQRGLSLAEKREKVLSVFAAPDALFFTEKVYALAPRRPARRRGIARPAHAQFVVHTRGRWAWRGARAVNAATAREVRRPKKRTSLTEQS